jgi:hypothetical protein
LEIIADKIYIFKDKLYLYFFIFIWYTFIKFVQCKNFLKPNIMNNANNETSEKALIRKMERKAACWALLGSFLLCPAPLACSFNNYVGAGMGIAGAGIIFYTMYLFLKIPKEKT